MSNFIFYDFETTGLSHKYDQVLQFAAIVTDESFQELQDSSIDIRCNLMPHIVPSPKALAITNVRPTILSNQELSHREFMHTIETWSAQWRPAIFLGYNSIGFDENMMRQGLYQSLHGPYLTNTNGNARGDIMRLAHAAYLFDENSLQIPMSSKGKPVFKLGALAKENDIDFDDNEAHDALYDVRKTIELASLIKQKVPNIWDAMIKNANKRYAIDLIQSQDIFASGETFFNVPYRWLMTCCGVNAGNSAQLGVFDLSYSPEDYLDLSVEKLIDVLNASPKIIRSVRTNAQPFSLPIKYASEDYWKHIDVTIEEATERAQTIKNRPEFQKRVGEALANRFEVEELSLHVEENIYGGFPSGSDKMLMSKFHDVSPEERALLIDQFEDARYKQIARRLVYFETPEKLPEKTKTEMDAWRIERITSNADEEKAPWRTLSEAREELEGLKNEDEWDNALHQEIDDFLSEMEKV